MYLIFFNQNWTFVNGFKDKKDTFLKMCYIHSEKKSNEENQRMKISSSYKKVHFSQFKISLLGFQYYLSVI